MVVASEWNRLAIAALWHVAVVGETKVNAPQLSCKGMNITQMDLALSRIPNVCHHVERFHWIGGHELSQFRLRSRQIIQKQPQSVAFIQADPPAVRMLVGFAASFTKSSEAEGKVSRASAVHSE